MQRMIELIELMCKRFAKKINLLHMRVTRNVFGLSIIFLAYNDPASIKLLGLHLPQFWCEINSNDLQRRWSAMASAGMFVANITCLMLGLHRSATNLRLAYQLQNSGFLELMSCYETIRVLIQYKDVILPV